MMRDADDVIRSHVPHDQSVAVSRDPDASFSIEYQIPIDGHMLLSPIQRKRHTVHASAFPVDAVHPGVGECRPDLFPIPPGETNIAHGRGIARIAYRTDMHGFPASDVEKIHSRTGYGHPDM